MKAVSGELCGIKLSVLLLVSLTLSCFVVPNRSCGVRLFQLHNRTALNQIYILNNIYQYARADCHFYKKHGKIFVRLG